MQNSSLNFDRLSSRERAVLNEIGNGFSTRAIGSLLNISAGTVNVHKQNIKNKLGIRNARHLFLAGHHFKAFAAASQ